LSQRFRTSVGGRIDRSRLLHFSFDGERLTGFGGDTLGSALLANGVHLVGRSFKYHRPRGIISAAAEEPNALVRIDRGPGRATPNLRATQVELYEGLVAASQNRWPTLRSDFAAVSDLLAPLFPAGFYYKTFMWPRSFWNMAYEPLIRRAAGLGRAPKEPDPDRYLHRYAHCDVLVIGSGPAGLAAALAAAETGARVLICDEQAEMGGSLLSQPRATIEGRGASDWISEALTVLGKRETVRLLPRTTAFGWFPDNLIGLLERVTDHLSAPHEHLPRERLWHVRAREVVIAAGAIERPLVFANNDRPGIMLAGAARTFINRYGAKAGSRVVVATADDAAYAAAFDLATAGVSVTMIADLRSKPDPVLLAAARAAGIDVMVGTAIRNTSGRHRVAKAFLSKIEEDHPAEPAASIDCDLVLMSGGWTPSVHLFSQSRGKLRFDQALRAFVPGTSAANERSAGACRGIFGLDSCLADGYSAGAAAAKAAGFNRVVTARLGSSAPMTDPMERDAHDRRTSVGNADGKAFVDFQNDVTAGDIRLATREGFRSIEHIKRYTTTGMATDQGKTSNMNALAIAADALAAGIPDVGLTTFRMPYTPVTFGALAGVGRGDLFDPVRVTPIHDWAVAQGAIFEDVGLWKRARYFPRDGEDMHAAVARECRAVRTDVGLFDASTLGKIEVVGPDAAEFLNRIYTNRLDILRPGQARYGLMLTEAGYLMDDGIVGCLAADRFHITTTTGGAARVLDHMEDYLQTEWSDLKVWLTSVTEQWATISVQGPKARDVITPLVAAIDLSPAAMPHMSVREGSIRGAPTRLFRVSFTGELGYEINVAADYGRTIWEAVLEAGRRHGVTPYGTEATHVLRAEKGYIIVGQETDGTITPDDLGLGWAVAKGKRDFVGRRSLALPDMAAPGRKQLIGLLTADPRLVLEEGAQIVEDPQCSIPMKMIGHVTSSYWSEALGRSVALALAMNGRQRMGTTLYLPMADRTIAAVVTGPAFWDPEGQRLHG
jgi:sarcosine oxidase subunit alpha